MDERRITVADVEHEHLEQVHRGAHWAYVIAVLGISTLLMLAFIAWLGASSV